MCNLDGWIGGVLVLGLRVGWLDGWVLDFRLRFDGWIGGVLVFGLRFDGWIGGVLVFGLRVGWLDGLGIGYLSGE